MYNIIYQLKTDPATLDDDARSALVFTLERFLVAISDELKSRGVYADPETMKLLGKSFYNEKLSEYLSLRTLCEGLLSTKSLDAIANIEFNANRLLINSN